MPRRAAPISSELKALGQRLTQFRQAHAPRSRLPEQFWHAATSLASREGVYRTARTLRLDYASLKKRAEASEHGGLRKLSHRGFGSQRTKRSKKTAPARTETLKQTPSPAYRGRLTAQTSNRTTPPTGRTTSPAEFVELLTDSTAADCLIEVESAGGARLRIQMRMRGPDVLTLVRDWCDRSDGAGRENHG